MPGSPLRTVLLYGALAGAVLGCLTLVSLAPLRLDWGRELVGAVIALVALVIGARLAERRRAPPAAPDRPAAPTPAFAPVPEAGSAPAPAPPGDAPPLSPRELEVLRLLAEGHSNKTMARALSLSENTIKTHLANVYAKLGVGRRTEALHVARRHRLIG